MTKISAKTFGRPLLMGNVDKKETLMNSDLNYNVFMKLFTADFNPFGDPEQMRQFLLNFQQQNPQFLQNQPQPGFHGGFASFTQPGFSPQNQPQPGFSPFQETDTVSPTQPERDVVPETQQSQRKKKGKGKTTEVTGTSGGPMAPKNWTPDEETTLGIVFVDLSENKTKGNAVRRDKFWVNVTKKWHEMMGYENTNYRTQHQLNSKWSDLRSKCVKFSGIYSNCVNNRRSGMNDTDVMKWAEHDYQLKSNGQPFTKHHVWNRIKEAPKWREILQESTEMGQSSSKRTKNSETNAYSPGMSDAHTNYAVDLEGEEGEDDLEIREPVRPRGRDTTKRASSSSRQTVSSIPSTTELASQLEEFTRFQREKHEDKKKYQEDRALRNDFKIIGSLPDEQLDEEEREIKAKLKKKLFAKYRDY